ncbi:MAG: YfhO family protein [Saprospiraceae bacterium]|nr:YfhO family protein [Saprospiraceae bacterium]
MKFDFKSLIPHVVAVVVFLVVSMAYFYPQLQGKVVSASDFNQFTAMAKEVRDYEKATSDVALWTTSMFGGMPTFQLTAPQKNNLVKYVVRAMRLGFSKPIGYFIAGMLSFYIAIIVLGLPHYIGIIGGILFAMTTGNIILMDTGHVTKLQAVLYSPPMVSGIILVFRNQLLKGGILFSLFFSMCVVLNHPQMIYYLGMVISLYVLYEIIKHIKEKEFVGLSKKLGILLIGTILGLGASASKLWTTYEYGNKTMRGKQILSSNAGMSQTSSMTDGLEWQYAMNWSNGGEDLMASYVPLFVGGSTQEIVDSDSELARKVPQLRNQPLPLYWGSLSSTSGPYYFGAVVFLLFVMGGIVVKGRLKWWLILGVLFTFLISLGKHFEVFNRLLFDYLPLYNKFRTPNSVLTVTGTFLFLLTGLGLNEIIKTKDKSKFVKPLLISAGTLSGLALFFILGGPSVFSFNGAYDSSFESIIDLVKDERENLMISSSLRSIGFILAASGILYFYFKDKLNNLTMISAIGIIALLDLWIIDKRYLNNDDFVSSRKLQQEFTPRPVDTQILSDSDPHYRVLDIQNFASANPSYHHKTIGGYHPAKLQRYQDIIDFHISKNNQGVLNMLNTKYVIFPSEGGQFQAQQNPDALGNAWFVKSLSKVSSADEEISMLESLDTRNEAVIHTEFSDYIGGVSSFSGTGNIQLSQYGLNELKYQSNSNEDQFAVFSEIWYNPGWKVYIDGNEVNHVRVNYILRGLKVPAGQHEIIFRFEPGSYLAGERISLICSGVIIFGLLFFFYLILKEKGLITFAKDS